MNRELLIADLKRDEGFVEHVYDDTRGFQTIGFGFLVDRRKNAGIPTEVAEFWLRWIVDRQIPALQAALPHWHTHPEPVQRALANMSYQLGLSGLLKFKKTLALIAEHRYIEAAHEALDSEWARQTPGRAKRQSDLIRSGASFVS